MKKQNNENLDNHLNRKSFHEWKKRRDIRLTAISCEVDLENREVIFKNENQMDLVFSTTNVDSLISNYVDPKDSLKVQESLLAAQHGEEKPITFRLIHPQTSKRLQMEYRYEIVYVKYASTRLNGILVNVRGPRPAKRSGRTRI